MTEIGLSTLAHTWLIDIDGTIVPHNGHLKGQDILLNGVENFWKSLPDQDVVILLTARSREQMANVEVLLRSKGMKFHHVICDLPAGERILINDAKPKGLRTAISVNINRDQGLDHIVLKCDPTL